MGQIFEMVRKLRARFGSKAAVGSEATDETEEMQDLLERVGFLEELLERVPECHCCRHSLSRVNFYSDRREYFGRDLK